jgi:hypothetical protein
MPDDYYPARKQTDYILITEYNKYSIFLITGLNFAYFLIFNALYLSYNNQGYK